MMRVLQVSIAAAVALLSMASPAMAHEEITPSTFATGKPTFFALTAANEKTVDLTKISLAAPANVPFGTTTREPSGWTAQKSDTEITWTGGKVPPDSFEQWGFEIEGADQPGPLSFKATMGFADGSSEDAEVAVTAVTPGAEGEAAATTTPPATATATPAVPTKSSSNPSDGLAVAALIVALLSGVLAGVALVAAIRRRNPASANGADPATSTKGQDW
ncbi:MAG TPA: hypothetical protein VF711_04580 [Acidimicrobiales bacterium]|jgi:hypothetical protein